MHYAYMDIRIYSEATEKLNMANAMLDTVSNRASNAYPTHSVTTKVKSPV
jgi:ppGpp synthetase/RelA/SpoT-type nucleotidyltranferase